MLLWIYCFRLFFIRTFVCLSISWSTAWNLGSFKVYSLFSYQCTSSILRIDFRSCSATSERIFQSHSSLSSLSDSLFILAHSQSLVNNFFIFLFHCPLRSSLSFETAYLEYHFYRHLSTGNFIYFFAFPWALKHFPVLSHATACIIYHACPELSILFLLFILFAQFTQF